MLHNIRRIPTDTIDILGSDGILKSQSYEVKTWRAADDPAFV